MTPAQQKWKFKLCEIVVRERYRFELVPSQYVVGSR